MFKKRAQAKRPKDEDDSEDTAITVSIPQDAFNLASATASTARRDSGESERVSQGSVRRSSIDAKLQRQSHQSHQPYQPWKPWNPQKLPAIGTDGHSGTSTSTLSALSTLSSPPSSTSSPNALKRNSQGVMLNLSTLISGKTSTSATAVSPASTDSTAHADKKSPPLSGGSTAQQQQPLEAQLWNAELLDQSPSSPAGPRYIPAVAGKYAHPRTGFGTGLGRMNTRSGDVPPRRNAHAATGERSHSRATTSSSVNPRTGYIPSADGHTSTPSSPAFHRYPASPRQSNYSDMNGSVDPGRIHSISDGARSTAPRDTQPYGTDGRRDDYSDQDSDLHDRKKDRQSSDNHQQHSNFPLIFTDPARVLRTRLFCLRKSRRLHPCVRLVVLLCLAGSVCFTTLHLIFLEGSPGGATGSGSKRRSFDYSEQQLRIRKMLGKSNIERVVSPFDVEAQNYSSHQWALDTRDIDNSKAVARVSEDYMLAKAFSGAMQPTRVIPFYFRASFKDENDDDDMHEDDDFSTPEGDHDGEEAEAVQVDPSLVTITTLITPDRYGVFLKLVRQYRGPISVATHIRTDEDQDKSFHELNEFFQENSILRKYVDLHVIVDNVDFQLNMWRNVARTFARTDYFMMLDVDFHIPSGLKNHLHHDPRIQDLLSSGAALVVPAFEYKVEEDPKDSKYFPDTKKELIPLIEKGVIRVFHDSFPPGHAATDTPRWMRMNPDAPSPGSRWMVDERQNYLEHEAEGERPYKVTNFEPKYEPYIILKREGTPWCDERFVGYGANKAACLFEIYISGIDFWVMPQDFLIHQYHDYPTTNRKNGRILNKQLFVSFQQEICFATLERMIVTGEWYTHKADNLRHQCAAFDGFLKSADQMAQDFEQRHPNSLLEDPIFVADENAQRKRTRLQMAGRHQGDGSYTEGDDARYGPRKGALGQQIVDDEQHLDPFMSRPRGRVWGGVHPKTYYVPPPPEYFLPIGGIDVDAAVENQAGDNTAVASDPLGQDLTQQHPPVNADELTGDKLEQYRQGIILPEHEGDRNRFAFPRDGEETAAENPVNGVADGGQGQAEIPSSGDRGIVDEGRERGPFVNISHDGSFEEVAERLEEHYRRLGLA
ncbi:hypothetical protein BGZ70_010039 [Mortierella alpina]|uniref:Glycosyltransferase family 49 protein n=1 Tax=Mortierella alpina TaxID=64518 RepID=A0A9P6J0K8_MORAP|nr:hypothetical protein BGZ70_010039 [Mortierella alpina]